MGYLTTVTFRNDDLEIIRENGQEVIDKIYDAIMSDNTEEIAVGPCCNCAIVQKTRHASDFTIYAHAGNGLFEINPYSKDFKKLIDRNPEFAERILDEMQYFIDSCKELIKK